MVIRRLLSLFFCSLLAGSLGSCGLSSDNPHEPRSKNTLLGKNLDAEAVDDVLSKLNCNKSVYGLDKNADLESLKHVPLQGAAICLPESVEDKTTKPRKFVGDLAKLSEALQAADPPPAGSCLEMGEPLLGVWVLDAKGSLFQAHIPNDGCSEHLGDWKEQNLTQETLSDFQ